MKRFLSWVVMIVVNVLACLLASLVGALGGFTRSIFDATSVSYIALLLVIVGGAILPVRLSEKISPSERGIRYVVWGVLSIVNYGGNLLLIIAGLISRPLNIIVSGIVCTIISFLLIADGLAETKH